MPLTRSFGKSCRPRKQRHRLRLEPLEPRLVLTDVAGVINTDTTWNLAGSPYNLTADVLVRNGATLTIEPGVQVVDNSSIVELRISDNGSGGVTPQLREGTTPQRRRSVSRHAGDAGDGRPFFACWLFDGRRRQRL